MKTQRPRRAGHAQGRRGSRPVRAADLRHRTQQGRRGPGRPRAGAHPRGSTRLAPHAPLDHHGCVRSRRGGQGRRRGRCAAGPRARPGVPLYRAVRCTAPTRCFARTARPSTPRSRRSLWLPVWPPSNVCPTELGRQDDPQRPDDGARAEAGRDRARVAFARFSGRLSGVAGAHSAHSTHVNRRLPPPRSLTKRSERPWTGVPKSSSPASADAPPAELAIVVVVSRCA